MIQQLRKMPGYWVVALGVVLTGLLGGCQTGSKPSNPASEKADFGFHVGDLVSVEFASQTGDKEIVPAVNQTVNEEGKISCSLIGSVTALGKTPAELQKIIHDLYVPKYFPELNVSVRGQVGFFWVDGEVYQRGRKDYIGPTTIVKAITDAGGFTDFANETSVRLTHGKHAKNINVKKAMVDPSYDVPIYPGDTIYVRRRLL